MNKRALKTVLVIGAAAAALALSACYSEGRYAGGYGPGDRYDTYYDGYYGNVNGGYWGSDSAYYYPGPDGHYMRDSGNHFRHDGFNGANGMHSGHPPQ